MASQAIPGLGTLLKIGDGGGPEVFTTIAEVKDITLPSMTRDIEDVTNHSSPLGMEELVTTIIRTAECTFDINWIVDDPTHDAQTGLQADLLSGIRRNFQIFLPTGDVNDFVPFTAYVTGFSATAPVGGVLGASVTLKPTGAVGLI